jgi:hypothetical protein
MPLSGAIEAALLLKAVLRPESTDCNGIIGNQHEVSKDEVITSTPNTIGKFYRTTNNPPLQEIQKRLSSLLISQ